MTDFWFRAPSLAAVDAALDALVAEGLLDPGAVPANTLGEPITLPSGRVVRGAWGRIIPAGVDDQGNPTPRRVIGDGVSLDICVRAPELPPGAALPDVTALGLRQIEATDAALTLGDWA